MLYLCFLFLFNAGSKLKERQEKKMSLKNRVHIRSKVDPGQEHVEDDHANRSQDMDVEQVHAVEDHLKQNTSEIHAVMGVVDILVQSIHGVVGIKEHAPVDGGNNNVEDHYRCVEQPQCRGQEPVLLDQGVHVFAANIIM